MRVRTTLFLALSLLTISTPALAGASHFGLRAGANFATFRGDLGEILEPESRVAASVGLVYEYDLAPQFSLHGELGYSGKGGVTPVSEGTDPSGNPTAPFDLRWSFEYLEIPLLLRGRFTEIGGATPFFEVGPAFGIGLSGRLKSDDPNLPDADLGGRMRLVDPGFAVGAGFTFAAGPGHAGVEARFTRGFGDLFDDERTAGAINQVWTVALSYTR